MVICLALGTVFAVGSPQDITGGSGASGIKNTTKNIWDTIATIVQVLAVAAVVFAGVRYMFASADQKADIKKGMIILVIGAVMVFGATAILKMIYGATSIIKDAHIVIEQIQRG